MTLDAEPVGQNEPAPNAGSESNAEANKGYRNIPLAPSIPPVPPSKTHCEITCKHEKDFWEKFKDRAEIVGIGILLVYTLYTIKMYSANKEAAEAANTSAKAALQSAKVAEDTLIASNRPWLWIKIAINGPLTFDNFGAILPVMLDISNVGHSPAIRVTPMKLTVIQSVSDFEPAMTEQAIKEQCHRADEETTSSNPDQNQTIFPTIPWQQPLGVLMSLDEVKKGGADLVPVVVWCVAYRADFNETLHHIGYAWNVQRKDGRRIDPKNGTVPVDQLEMCGVCGRADGASAPPVLPG